jgi:Holliday junction resolvase-like predicted endonuclease
MKYTKIIRKCKYCNKEFLSTRKAIFCSQFCSYRYNHKPYKNGYINPPNQGAISELIVCADLIKKGYEVFRSVSPSAKVDLLIKKAHRLYSVEVKTIRVSEGTGRVDKRQIKADYLVTYFPEKNEIKYFKNIKEKFIELPYL